MKKIGNLLEARQVLIYFFAIFGGAAFGLTLGNAYSFESAISPALALMLFATFLQVPLVEIGRALRNLRFIGALFVANFVAVPLLAWGLVQLLPPAPMLRLGVLFVLLAPCIDYVISFTYLGKGNARLLLAMTPLLLIVQIVCLPIYLGVMLGSEVATVIQLGPFLQAFVTLIVLPFILAAGVQWWLRRDMRGLRVREALDLLPVPATALVLFIVMMAVMPQINLAQKFVLYAVPVYVVFAVAAPLVAKLVATLARLEAVEARTLAFSTAYRNSLVILPLAFAVPGGVPLLPAIILMQTMVELFFLPAYVRLIPRFFS